MDYRHYLDDAENLIDQGAPVAYDVADDYGQIFDNVAHMAWFKRAVAERIAGQQDEQ
jgi:hypothetical protein